MGMYYGLSNCTKKVDVCSYWKGSPPTQFEMSVIIHYFGWEKTDDIVAGCYCNVYSWSFDHFNWVIDKDFFYKWKKSTCNHKNENTCDFCSEDSLNDLYIKTCFDHNKQFGINDNNITEKYNFIKAKEHYTFDECVEESEQTVEPKETKEKYMYDYPYEYAKKYNKNNFCTNFECDVNNIKKCKNCSMITIESEKWLLTKNNTFFWG